MVHKKACQHQTQLRLYQKKLKTEEKNPSNCSLLSKGWVTGNKNCALKNHKLGLRKKAKHKWYAFKVFLVLNVSNGSRLSCLYGGNWREQHLKTSYKATWVGDEHLLASQICITALLLTLLVSSSAAG